MIIGVVRETFPGEDRVAMVPRVMDLLTKTGAEFLVESSAGEAAGFPDAEYRDKGARIERDRATIFQTADVILQMRTLGANPLAGRADVPLLRAGQAVIGFCEPLTAIEECAHLAAQGVTTFAMELIPRITRAQSMDALSSMATIAGYKAVLLAASALPRMFPMLMTAAGTITPARVFVLGAGVAGLQAIATARRLGAVVSGYDVRPAVQEQVESLGARFIRLSVDDAGSEDKSGYAKAMGDEFYRRQREMIADVVREQDVLITTAAVPGKKAPVLITSDMVHSMAPGSVVVDLAAERGGNCELTQPGQNVTYNGVTIMGLLNVPATVPYHASQMYARNIATFLRHLLKDGKLAIDTDDEITRETLVTLAGDVVHPRVREAMGLEPSNTGELVGKGD
jgi:NAD(P) transhydrogenase subunit alpha